VIGNNNASKGEKCSGREEGKEGLLKTMKRELENIFKPWTRVKDSKDGSAFPSFQIAPYLSPSRRVTEPEGEVSKHNPLGPTRSRRKEKNQKSGAF